MSRIATFVRMRTDALDRCLDMADRVEPARRDAFAREWTAAVQEHVVFDGSGDLLTAYLLAQSSLNDVDDPFDSPEGMRLAKVFTAAFPVRAPQRFPPFEPRALQQFCADEWGDEDAAGMQEGLAHARAFVDAGMARIGPDHAVVFVIN